MEIMKIDHIGIAVNNLDEQLKFYTDVLGLKVTGMETVEEQKVKVAFLPVGDTEIELLESTDPQGPIARFIEKNGEGIQHISFQVADIKQAIKDMKDKGMIMLDETPRYGAGGAQIAFMHPKCSHRVLVELSQRNSNMEV